MDSYRQHATQFPHQSTTYQFFRFPQYPFYTIPVWSVGDSSKFIGGSASGVVDIVGVIGAVGTESCCILFIISFCRHSTLSSPETSNNVRSCCMAAECAAVCQ